MGRRIIIWSFIRHAMLLLLVVLSHVIPSTTGSTNERILQQQQNQHQRPPTTTSTKGVFTLNSKNFDSSLRDGNLWLIEFYAPW